MTKNNIQPGLKAYVINLESRTDRWESVLQQADLLNLDVIRVNAVTASELDSDLERFVPSGVAATWKSHQLAMREFLQTDASNALILEDDFVVCKNFQSALDEVRALNEYDFVQLGILDPTRFDMLIRKLLNFRDINLKILGLVSNLFSLSLRHRVILKEQMNIPFSFVTSDIRAGGHAYLISREFASAMQTMNVPAFLSTDGAFMALGGARVFRVFRLRKTCFRQSTSPSSVESRFNLQI